MTMVRTLMFEFEKKGKEEICVVKIQICFCFVLLYLKRDFFSFFFVLL